MEKNAALISVIVPVFNGASFIAEALDSVLAQAYDPLEIIVVDDGSTDDTAVVVQKFGASVSYYYQSNRGSGAARNYGVRLARGNWLAFLDADDVWAGDKLQKQTAVFQQDPTVELVWGHVVEFVGALPDDRTRETAVPGHHPGTMLIRRDTFTYIGGYSETYIKSEVVEWMSRVLHHKIRQVMLPDVVMYRRLHQTNKGKITNQNQQEYLYVLKQHLERQRRKK